MKDNYEERQEEYENQQQDYNGEGNNYQEEQEQQYENNQVNENDDQYRQQNIDQEEGNSKYDEQQEDDEQNYKVNQKHQGQQKNGIQNEKIDKKVETHKNNDGSVTTITKTTTTKTRRGELDYLMPTIEEQQETKGSNKSKHVNIQEHRSHMKNNSDLGGLTSQQQMIIQNLKGQVRDEKQINTIQGIEIENLKYSVRRLQGNFDSLNKQVNVFSSYGDQYRTSSPQKTESRVGSAHLFNQIKEIQDYEKERKQQMSDSKVQKKNGSDKDQIDNKSSLKGQGEKIYLSDFQKSLWIPEKEKFAERQLYELNQSEQKQKTLKPLKVSVKEKKKQSIEIDGNIKKNDMASLDEEMNKLAQQNREQFVQAYSQNQLKMQKEIMEDYQKRKQQLIENSQNRVKENMTWEESLHPVTRAKSQKHLGNHGDRYNRYELYTPNYMERQLYHLKNELQQSSRSIPNPMQESGLSPESIRHIAGGSNILRSLQIASSNQLQNLSDLQTQNLSESQLQNLSESPQKQKIEKQERKIFSYQVTDIDKNFVFKTKPYKQPQITYEELMRQQENLENIKEKNREEERKKFEKYNMLKASPGYRLTRKSTEEIRSSAVSTSQSPKKPKPTYQPFPQFRLSFPSLQGLNQTPHQSSQLQQDSIGQSGYSSIVQKMANDKNYNPYSVSSNIQIDQSPSTPKKQKKSFESKKTNISSQSVSFLAGNNPYQIPTSQKQAYNKYGKDQKYQKGQSKEDFGHDEQYIKTTDQSSIISGNNQNDNYSQISNSSNLKNRSRINLNSNGKPSYKDQQQMYTDSFSNKNLDFLKENPSFGKNSGNKKQNQYDNQNLQNRDGYNTFNNQGRYNSQDSKGQNNYSNINSNQNSRISTANLGESYNPEKKSFTGLKNLEKSLQNQKKKNEKGESIYGYQPKQNYYTEKYENSNQPDLGYPQNQDIGRQKQQDSDKKQQKNVINQQNPGKTNNQQEIFGNQQQKGVNSPQKQGVNNKQYGNNNQSQGLNGQNQQKIGNQPKPTVVQKQNVQQNQPKQNLKQEQDLESSQKLNKPTVPSYNQQGNSNKPQQQFSSPFITENQNKSIDMGNKNDEIRSQSRSPKHSGDHQDMEEQNPTVKSQNQNTHNSANRQHGQHSPSNLQGISDAQGINKNFTQFNHNPSNINQTQKQEPQKRQPKVREQYVAPKKSEFVEQLEKEAVQDNKIQISDKKVFLKEMESDDEPMFGYDESDQEEQYQEEEDNVEDE